MVLHRPRGLRVSMSQSPLILLRWDTVIAIDAVPLCIVSVVPSSPGDQSPSRRMHACSRATGRRRPRTRHHP